MRHCCLGRPYSSRVDLALWMCVARQETAFRFFIPLGALGSREDDTRCEFSLCGWFAFGSHRVEYLGASSTAPPADGMAHELSRFRNQIGHSYSKTAVTGETLLVYTSSNKHSELIVWYHPIYFSLGLVESRSTPDLGGPGAVSLRAGQVPGSCSAPRMVTATTARPASDPSRPTPRWFARINFNQQPLVATIPA